MCSLQACFCTTVCSSKMLCRLLAFLLLLSAASADSSTTTDLLWPLPRSTSFGNEVYSLNNATFAFVGAGPGGGSYILNLNLARYRLMIFQTPTPFYPSGGGGNVTQELDILVVNVESADETLGLTTSENYTLNVTGGKAQMTADTVFGALRGLETFTQLVYRNLDGSNRISEANITDYPRFQYRGTMIDTSRHYLSTSTIMKQLDAMVYNKFNVLHWHIVDDQSFPYESYTYPNLSSMGAYDSKHVYTQEFIATVIEEAKNVGIRVIVEFDTPGHTQSWGKGQPDLLTECYSGGKPTGTYGPINPTLNTTWDFLKKFYSEIATVFPDQYLHLGGDEVNFFCWQSNPQIQQWMKEHGYTKYSQLEQYYETNLLSLVAALQKQYIVWQEIFDNGLKVLPDTVIDVWKGGTAWMGEMGKVTAAGHKAILSACWYLNYIQYGPDWLEFYQCDPQEFDGTDAQKALVVGGHAAMWGEFVDSTNFISQYWPRAGAVGERLWSDKSVTDIPDAITRLRNQRCRMISRSVQAEPVTGPSFCSYVA